MKRSRRLLALLALCALAGCKTELNRGLGETDANEEVALLLRGGIPAERVVDPKDNSLTILVDRSRFADAVDLLRAHGMPRPHYDTIPEVFRADGLIASPVAERARMVYALGEALSRTIAAIDGVLTARVQIVLPDNDPLQRNVPPSAASVLIRTAPGAHVAELLPQIKMLVANGVAGLSYDHVSVVMVPAAITAAAESPQSPPLREVAGIWVQQDDALMLQAVLGGGAAVLALLAGGVVWLLWRLRTAAARRVGGPVALR